MATTKTAATTIPAASDAPSPADTKDDDDIDGDDDDEGSPTLCSECLTGNGPFSKRQQKLALERKPARCKTCIDKDVAATEGTDTKLDATAAADVSPNKKIEAEVDEKDDDYETDDNSGLDDADANKRVYFSDGESAKASGAEEEVETSLNAIKKRVLGRLVQTSSLTPHRQEEAAALLDEAQSINLRKELSCAICHELLHQPISLPCGHSFCQECFQWWTEQSSASQQSSCPTCRAKCGSPSQSPPQVSVALRACILALYADDLQTRIALHQDRLRKAVRGEDGGAHAAGYAELCRESKQIATVESGGLHLTRSVRMDADDQRMQLALVMRDGVSRIKVMPPGKQLSIDLCLLTMEEDEVEDADGFPWKLDDDDEDDNEAFVARHVQSFVEAKARIAQKESGGVLVPIARHSLRDGQVTFLIDLEPLQGAHALHFCDEESGATLEILIPSKWWQSTEDKGGGNNDDASMGSPPNHCDRDNDNGLLREFSEDDDEEDADEFEDDGFIVDEDEDDVEEEDGEEGIDEDDDPCCVCKKGGELIVCDGGVNEIEGCGKSFHIDCIGLDEVPPGDWICENCGIENGMDVGMEGYEYPVSPEEMEVDNDNGSVKMAKKRVLEESDDDNDAEEPSENGAAKKRKVILDSDDDDSE